MGPKDVLNYVVFDNPVSKTILSPFYSTSASKIAESVSPPKVDIRFEHTPLWKLAAEQGCFVRLAGISGATAVILGAYGAHRKYPKDSEVELKAAYETANRFHFLHSVALLGLPLCRYPQVTGTLMILGGTLFCGTLYYRAFTGTSNFAKLAPTGGVILIFAWLSMAL